MPVQKPQRARRARLAPAVPRLRIRLYRHGLGDCFLLRFGRTDGKTFNVLIDCGLISVATEGKAKMNAVVGDVIEACDNHLDVVVMTHEHWDHASGFAAQQAQALFDGIDIGEVWYAWTEDEKNPLGVRLSRERANKVEALAAAERALQAVAHSPLAAARASSLRGVLQFFGADTSQQGGAAVGKTRAAFHYLRNRKGVRKRYLSPSDAPLAVGALTGVRVFVLGPPQDEAMLKKSAPTKSGREVYEMAAEAALADNVRAAFDRMAGVGPGPDKGQDDCPFDTQWRHCSPCVDSVTAPQLCDLIEQSWNRKGEAWRRIDDDWTQIAETLALSLDAHTNNTCLVLAFELVESGEVFLFPADAQVGNWLSWQSLKWTVPDGGGSREVIANELLRRTVFYKVGHHGSHNATLRALGLEQMQSEDLVAYIPVVREEAEKNRWMGMPFTPLVNRLREKTQGRLLQADDTALPSDHDLSELPERARTAFRKAVALSTDKDKLFVEITYA